MTDTSDRSGLRNRLSDWERMVRLHPDVHAERYWPSYVSLALAVALQLRLPAAYDLGPKWVLPAVETLLLVVLAAGRYLSPTRREPATIVRLHLLTIGLIAVVSLDNLTSLALLVRLLLRGLETDGRTLVLSALAIWVTNVVVFALWFWEFDGGGPISRRAGADGPRAFLFPQMQLDQGQTGVSAPDAGVDRSDRGGTEGQSGYAGWLPDFVDYIYVSFTNATAFSPTDTMPLSRWAKMLMLVQASASLLTVALIAGRAVNILK